MSLNEALCEKYPLHASIEQLATPEAFSTANPDPGLLPHIIALRRCNDPSVIKLLISRHPAGLVSAVRVRHHNGSNHDEIHRLLLDCYAEFKQLMFPRLIEL